MSNSRERTLTRRKEGPGPVWGAPASRRQAEKRKAQQKKEKEQLQGRNQERGVSQKSREMCVKQVQRPRNRSLRTDNYIWP